MKTSRPGAFPTLRCCIVVSTFCKDIGLRRIWLCSSLMTLGVFLVIFSIAGSWLMWGSCCTLWKWVRGYCSVSLCFSSCSPCWFWRWVMLLCILLWIVVRWKNFVFHSPSLSHLIHDFCFQSISTCFSLSKIYICRWLSCSAPASHLPSAMILYYNFTIYWLKAPCAWKILPKVKWFHCLMLFLRL